MKFGICNEIFHQTLAQPWELDAAMAFASKAGYDAIEIAPFTIRPCVADISQQERQLVRGSARSAGIEISGIHWVLVQTEGLHLTSPDAAVRRRTAAYFCELADFCADIGGHYIVVGSPKQRQVAAGVDPGRAWEWATETFREAADRARERDVVFCLEPLAPGETNFINTAAEAVAFVRQLESPNLRIILDVKAMSAESKPIPEIIRDSAGYLAYFHANDRNLKGPGFGDVDFNPIAAALKEAGYDGYVSVEVFKFEEGPEAIATRSLDYLKKVFA